MSFSAACLGGSSPVQCTVLQVSRLPLTQHTLLWRRDYYFLNDLCFQNSFRFTENLIKAAQWVLVGRDPTADPTQFVSICTVSEPRCIIINESS